MSKILENEQENANPDNNSKTQELESDSKSTTLQLVFHESEDPTLKFFYRPHTISTLIAILLGFVYVAIYTDDSNVELNTKWALVAICCVFVVFGIILFRDGPFIRPHPAFWRAILALNVLYMLALTYLLFQNKNDARQMMTFMDPDLGVELPERSYAEHCELTPTNLWNGIDIFVLAHSVGWFAKALILRDNVMCWILSISFEVMEYSLQHQLPNFAECWWDHWILDVFTCNWLGIYTGMKFCEYFKMKTYSWHGIRQIPSLTGKFKRAGAQLTPHSWTTYNWAPTKSFKNFFGFFVVIVMVTITELNVFYLKYFLWIPPEHPIIAIRLNLFFLFALPAGREYYEYYSNPTCKRLGAHAWMVLAAVMTEVLVIFKFSKGEFPAPFPNKVIAFWSTVLVLLVGYVLWQFVLTKNGNTDTTESDAVYNNQKDIKSQE
ncbi:hypothetical protein H4219_004074 [Mycoemilia scoparia]|uniref:L-serine-phosphatidylethanolamine phosphatidyltransferase n=1 Tax=Mycoemilia scoparia TaxID=417184 RepID=A0A9W8DNE4_9FUNG|nr:hypothetical protein H4219_004074 [Mycoemilia scoparia]